MDDILGSKKFQHIVEIGCNDLFLLRLLQHRAQKLTGIDPILKTCKEKDLPPKIKAIGDFFENVNLEDEISIVICKDTLEHVGDPKEFMAKIIEKGTSETMFFFQFPCLETLLGGCRFDQVFHQHLNYFSLASIQYLLDALGCELVDYRFNFNLWGAILIAFRKRRKSVRQGKEKKIQKITSETILQRYAIFQKNMEVTNERLECFKEDKIYGYGAALMLPVLSYYLKNDLSSLKGIIDDDKKKDGLYYINLPVKIVHSSKMTHYQDAVVLITAISSSDNVRKIISKLSLLNPRDIIVPLNIF
jgi:hypothetical protein